MARAPTAAQELLLETGVSLVSALKVSGQSTIPEPREVSHAPRTGERAREFPAVLGRVRHCQVQPWQACWEAHLFYVHLFPYLVFFPQETGQQKTKLLLHAYSQCWHWTFNRRVGWVHRQPRAQREKSKHILHQAAHLWLDCLFLQQRTWGDGSDSDTTSTELTFTEKCYALRVVEQLYVCYFSHSSQPLCGAALRSPFRRRESWDQKHRIKSMYQIGSEASVTPVWLAQSPCSVYMRGQFWDGLTDPEPARWLRITKSNASEWCAWPTAG